MQELLDSSFFDRDASCVAVELLGVLIRHRYGEYDLSARIIETESYYIFDKGSHASLGKTPSRVPLFMPPGTIYMYYARGGDSLNFSCRGEGNAVLIKSAFAEAQGASLEMMHSLNPLKSGGKRQNTRLCSGQTLLCKALNLKVTEHSGTSIDNAQLRLVKDGDFTKEKKFQSERLGIPEGRDEHLMQRFILAEYAQSATHNPIRSRKYPSHTFTDRRELLWDKTAVGFLPEIKRRS